MHNELLAHALQLHRQGQLQPAMKAYEELLKLSPDDASALHGLGVAKAQAGMHEEALAVLEKATKIYPAVSTHLQLARLHMHMDKPILAIAQYDKVIEIDSAHVQAHLEQGMCMLKTGQHYTALRTLHTALRMAPDSLPILFALVRCHCELHQYSAAVKVLSLAERISPDEIEIKRISDQLQRDILGHRERLLQRVKPQHLSNPEKLFNAGKRLIEAGKPGQALEFLDAVLALDPRSAISHQLRGIALTALQQRVRAIESFDIATAIDPQAIDAFMNCGGALFEIPLYTEAAFQFEKVLQLNPVHQPAIYFLASALSRLDRHHEAYTQLEKLRALNSDFPNLYGELISSHLSVCNWSNYDEVRQLLLDKVREGKAAALPLQLLPVSDSGELQLKLAKLHTENRFPRATDPDPPLTKKRLESRISVGYFSMDFRNHPVAYLTAELLESHDRTRYKVYAFYYGQETSQAIHQRIRHGVDHFFDVRSMSDVEVARLAREHGIDIAIDLAGYTANARPGIFASRAAPVQVSYLGYPGTMGTPHLDYIVGDQHVIPLGLRSFYAEKVIDLPCYQVTDTSRSVDPNRYSRADFGLRNEDVVFCCFNSCQKITPTMFSVWMSILADVPKSCLFLYEQNTSVKENLVGAARGHGIEPDRLIFSGVLSPLENLSRYTCTDLFLDTFPFNAGTTASDALWAGVPVLTLAGEAFASRMATSLVHAVGLPELSVTSLEDYRALAIALGNDRQKLQSFKQRLATQRVQASVFRTKDQARRLEDAFEQALQRFHKGLPPADIQVT